MNVVDPIDIAEAAVSAIHYHARPRMFLNQLLRLPFSDLPESALAERSRSEKPRNFSPRKSRCPLVVKIVPDQKYLVPGRSQIFRQREICAVHSPVLMESSADDEPGLPLACRTVISLFLLLQGQSARADLFWNFGRSANHNQSFFVDPGHGSMYRRIPPSNVMFTLGSRPLTETGLRSL